jgi:RNA polymerase sigma-70 factor (ECF subfamily)
VDDLLQETFVVAFRKQGEFAGRSAPRTWLHSIAVRVSMNHRRGRKRFLRFHERLAKEPQQHPPAPDSEALKKERQALVFKVLDRLPGKQREVFVLYELQELEGAEIAEILAIPEGTVWTRLHHARKRFKRLIAAQTRGEG